MLSSGPCEDLDTDVARYSSESSSGRSLAPGWSEPPNQGCHDCGGAITGAARPATSVPVSARTQQIQVMNDSGPKRPQATNAASAR